MPANCCEGRAFWAGMATRNQACGFRIIARRNGAGVRPCSRNGYDFTARFPLAVAAVAALPARSFLIDGEAIVTDESGLAVFELVRRHRHGAKAVLCAFDLVEPRGRGLAAGTDRSRHARLLRTSRRYM